MRQFVSVYVCTLVCTYVFHLHIIPQKFVFCALLFAQVCVLFCVHMCQPRLPLFFVLPCDFTRVYFLFPHIIWNICLHVYSLEFLKMFAQGCTCVFSRECTRNCSFGFRTRVCTHVSSVREFQKCLYLCTRVNDITCKCLCKRASFL